MRFHKLVFIVSLSLFLFGCFGSSPQKSNTNNSKSTPNQTNSSIGNQISNKSNKKNEGPVKVTKTPTPEEVNEAETLKPIVQAYCTAMRKGNNAALQKVYSKATWATLQKDAREEGKTVAAYLKELEPVGNTCKVINEQIQGNKGVAIVTTKSYPTGVKLIFVKEGNDWKMTNQGSDLQIVDDATKKSGK